MNCAVCTLFEGSYHQGVAVFVNSLVAAGFTGDVHVGFRGTAAPWLKGLKDLAVTPQVRIRTMPLQTSAHLTNYKPDFMLDLFRVSANNTNAIFYFDPDIVIDDSWDNFIDWVTCGVAVCEDVNSPLAENNPRRVGWRRFLAARGITLRYRSSCYANGGFVGVQRSDKEFLMLWAKLQEYMWDEIGGAGYVGITGGKSLGRKTGFGNCFGKTDQDALNAALEAWPGPVSMLNKQAMGFSAGGAILPHALGTPKPWAKAFVRSALNGRPPTLADKRFWFYAEGPLRVFSPATVQMKLISIKLASAIGRFVRRG